MHLDDFPLTGGKLTEWRNRMGWTQQQAAAALYISPVTVRAYETEELPVPPVVAMAACWLSDELRRPAAARSTIRGVRNLAFSAANRQVGIRPHDPPFRHG
jgi:transcriptional regulator with XRE-family HTH domain